MSLRLNPEYDKLLPKMSEEEFAELKNINTNRRTTLPNNSKRRPRSFRWTPPLPRLHRTWT